MRINDTSPKVRTIDPRTVADALGARIEAPILFSGEMVRAILDGRKTQTRRIEKRPRLAKLRKGDRLWVRETFHEFGPDCIAYRADGIGPHDDLTWRVERWRPSIHMPKRASRLTLELTEDPRTERLQDITDRDALAEGMSRTPILVQSLGGVALEKPREGGPRDHFRIVWESLHGPGSWEANPEVLVLTFRRVEE